MGYASRLTSLRATPLSNLNEMLDQGRDGIGQQAAELPSLPPSDDQPGSGSIAQLGRNMQRAVASATQWFAQQLKQVCSATEQDRGSSPAWMDDLQQWARRQLKEVSAAMKRPAINSYIVCCACSTTIPIRGYATRFVYGDSNHRGRSIPSNSLAEQEVDFNWNSLTAGGPGGRWEIPSDYQARLVARYRQLAQRELHLGRYRRAAYIYGHLLSELHLAAGALKAGKHWREAAVIYQKIGNGETAARCLEAGAYWTEAIELYEAVQLLEKAGDLSKQLELTEQANEFYRRAVDAKHQCNNYVDAARIQRQKLGDVEGALKTLWEGWPASGQAHDCLREAFQLLGRTGRHETAVQQIRQLRSQPLSLASSLAAATVLSDNAGTYPERGVAKRAADATLAIVARSLPGAGEVDASRLVDAVSRMAPEDRLLRRDCRRFVQQNRQPPCPPSSPSRRTTRTFPSRRIRQRVRFRLAENVRWRAAQCVADGFLAVGNRKQDMAIVRSNWRGAWQHPERRPWRIPVGDEGKPILILRVPNTFDALVQVAGGQTSSRPRRVFPCTKQFPLSLAVVSHTASSDDMRGCDTIPGQPIWIAKLTAQGTVALEAWDASGCPISSRELDVAPSPQPHLLPVHVRRQEVYVGVSNELWISSSDGSERFEAGHIIRGLCGSPPNTLPRVAMTLDSGVLLLWRTARRVQQSIRCAESVENPLATFTYSGHLVVAGGGLVEVYSTHQHRAELVASMPSSTDPVAVLPADGPRRFAVVDSSGKVSIFSIGRV